MADFLDFKQEPERKKQGKSGNRFWLKAQAFLFSFLTQIKKLTKNRRSRFILITSFSAVFVLIVFGFLFIFSGKGGIDQKLVIKPVVVKTTETVVAGYPVKWTMLVKRSQINNNQYLVQLPKGAKNIKIQTINGKQAKTIFEAQSNGILYPNQPQQQIVMNRRNSIGSVLDVAQTVVDTISEQVTQTSDNTYVDLSTQSLMSSPEQGKSVV